MTRIVRLRVLEIYQTPDGIRPYIEWILAFNDLNVRTRIERRVKRIILGNMGDHRPIKNGGGVWELRMHFGPGYRVYYGEDGPHIVVLLLGGSKRNQSRDIALAKNYWFDYLDNSDED